MILSLLERGTSSVVLKKLKVLNVASSVPFLNCSRITGPEAESRTSSAIEAA